MTDKVKIQEELDRVRDFFAIHTQTESTANKDTMAKEIDVLRFILEKTDEDDNVLKSKIYEKYLAGKYDDCISLMKDTGKTHNGSKEVKGSIIIDITSRKTLVDRLFQLLSKQKKDVVLESA